MCTRVCIQTLFIVAGMGWFGLASSCLFSQLSYWEELVLCVLPVISEVGILYSSLQDDSVNVCIH